MSLPTEVAIELCRGTFVEAGAFKVSLYTVDLTVTTAQNYAGNTGNETVGTGYPITGFPLSSDGPNFWRTVGATAVYAPAETQSSTGSTFTFRSILIYNSTATNPNDGLYFFNAGSDQVVSNGQLTIVWPTPDATTGLVRVPQ